MTNRPTHRFHIKPSHLQYQEPLKAPLAINCINNWRSSISPQNKMHGAIVLVLQGPFNQAIITYSQLTSTNKKYSQIPKHF